MSDEVVIDTLRVRAFGGECVYLAGLIVSPRHGHRLGDEVDEAGQLLLVCLPAWAFG